MKRLLPVLCVSIVGTVFADNENFNGLDKSRTDFTDASLKNSSWVGTTVTDATFANADISGSTFDGTIGFTTEQLYSTKNYATDNTFENLTLSNLGSLGNLDLSSKTLNGIIIKDTKFAGIYLNNAKADDITFSGVNINRVAGRRNQRYAIDLSGLTSSNINIINSTITATNRYYACGIYANSDIRGLNISNSTISGEGYGIYINGGNTYNLTLNGSVVSNAKFDGTVENSDFSNTIFEKGAYFQSVKNTNFNGTVFSTKDFQGNVIGGAEFYELENVDFTNATIAGSTFCNETNFSLGMIKQTADYKSGILDSITIDCSMDGFNIAGMKFINGELYNLSNSDLSNTDLSGTTFNGSLSNVNFTNATITGTTFNSSQGFSMEVLKQTSDYKNGVLDSIKINCGLDGFDMSGIKFINATFGDINNSNFTNADLSGTTFNGTLSNVDFTNATIAGSVFKRNSDFTVDMLKQTIDYRNGIISAKIYCKLDNLDAKFKQWTGAFGVISHSDFSGSKFIDFDFDGDISNSIFKNVVFENKYDNSFSMVESSDFTGAKFISSTTGLYAYSYSAASLRNCDFSNAEFSGVTRSVYLGNIVSCIFNGSNFNGTSYFAGKITDCDFSNAVFVSGSADTEFRKEISSSNFSNVIFKGISGALFESNLTDVDFTGSTISNSTFEGSLTNVVFENAKIDGCKFKAANAFTSDMLKQTADYKNKIPIRQLYINSVIENVDFAGRAFTGDSYAFSVSELKDGNFSNASFSTVSDSRGHDDQATIVVRGGISNCDFKNSVFSSQSYSLYAKGDVTNTTFENATIGGYLNLEKNVSGCNFSNAKLGEFSIGNVSDSDFVETKFSGHGKIDSMVNSNATKASFDETQIKNIESSSFKNAKFYTSSSGVATVSFVLNTGDIKNSDFSGISVVNATNNRKGLFDSDGIEWRGYAAAFDSATIENVDFSNSSFECYDVSGTGKYRTAAASFMDASLKNVNLSNCKFICNLRSEGVIYAEYATSRALDFRNATLENVDLSNCTIASSVYWDQKGCSEALAIGIDFSGATLYNVNFEGLQFSLSSGGNGVMSMWYGESRWYDGKVVPISMANTTFKRVSFANSNITNNYIESTANYQTKDMSDFDLSGTSLAEIDLSGQNLTNSKFRNADLSKANFEGANLTNVDLRGADLTDVSGKYTLKNTIMTDGVIKNFSMTTANDSIVIAKHSNKTASLSRMARGFSTYNGISAKISEADSVISGGAKMTIDGGGLLEVVDGKSLTVADGGILEFNIGEDYIGAMLSLESGSSFIFDGGEIVINLSSALAGNGMYTFELIDALNGSFTGCDSLAKGGNIKLLVDGEVYGGDWSFTADTSGLFVSVPEPSTYAAIFGILALGFVIYRRRK